MAVSEAKKQYNRTYYLRKKEEQGSYYKETRQAYYEKNKEAYGERSKSWYADQDNKMKRREKIHKVDFKEMYENQDGLCAIGGEPLPEDISAIHVDHDHITGLRRGLACRPHNVGLGMFNDDWEILEKAAKYIFNAKVRYINGNY